MRPRLRGLGRAHRRWAFLHHKLKHSIASVVLLNPTPDGALPAPVLLAMEHIQRHEERRIPYPVRLEAIDALAWAAEEASSALQVILNARSLQLYLRDPFVLCPNAPVLDDKLAVDYQGLLARHYTGALATDLNIDLTVNGLRLDDPWLTGTSAEIIDALCGEFWPIQTGDETETESVPSRVMVHPRVVQAMEQSLDD